MTRRGLAHAAAFPKADGAVVRDFRAADPKALARQREARKARLILEAKEALRDGKRALAERLLKMAGVELVLGEPEPETTP